VLFGSDPVPDPVPVQFLLIGTFSPYRAKWVSAQNGKVWSPVVNQGQVGQIDY